MTAAIRAEGRFELLIRSGNGWTPAGRFRTRRSAEAAARDMGAVEAGATIPAGAPRYLIEDRRHACRQWLQLAEAGR